MTQPNILDVPQEATLYQRIASGDGATLQRCFDFCRKYNHPEPQDRDQLALALATICVDNGEDALYDLAKLHPDTEFITFNSTPSYTMSAAGGRNDNGGGGYHNYSGKCGCGGSMKDTGNTAPVTTAQVMPVPGMPAVSMDNLITGVIICVVAAGALGFLSLILILANKKG